MAASSRAQEKEKRKNGLREIPQFAMNNAIYIEEWYVFGLSISFASFNFVFLNIFLCAYIQTTIVIRFLHDENTKETCCEFHQANSFQCALESWDRYPLLQTLWLLGTNLDWSFSLSCYTHTHKSPHCVTQTARYIYIYYIAGNRLEIWFTSNHIYILYVTFSVEGEDSSSPDI